MIDIGFFSNGHGEDTIACKVLDRLREMRPSLSIEGWPMVGEGTSYSGRGVPIVGSPNLLPSFGFATINPKLMLEDLRSGWIATHWRQYTAARGMRGRYRLAIAVGDIIPILAAVTARTPFMFIGCAKSYYYHPGRAYTPLERKLLRKHCMLTFPRDRKTIPELDKDGVPNIYLGNPISALARMNWSSACSPARVPTPRVTCLICLMQPRMHTAISTNPTNCALFSQPIIASIRRRLPK